MEAALDEYIQEAGLEAWTFLVTWALNFVYSSRHGKRAERPETSWNSKNDTNAAQAKYIRAPLCLNWIGQASWRCAEIEKKHISSTTVSTKVVSLRAHHRMSARGYIFTASFTFVFVRATNSQSRDTSSQQVYNGFWRATDSQPRDAFAP